MNKAEKNKWNEHENNKKEEQNWDRKGKLN